MARALCRAWLAFATCVALAGPALADCVDRQAFMANGEITTKGGERWSYGVVIGGDGGMRGTLSGRAGGQADVTFDLMRGYHIDFAGEGLARRLAPAETAAEPPGTRLTVALTPRGRLPEAEPGKGWSGRVLAHVFAQGPDDYNRREIATARLEGRYSFLDEKRADISGCSYRLVPVELVLTRKDDTVLQRRLLHFPDLGVSVVTIWGPDADGPQRRAGITAVRLGN